MTRLTKWPQKERIVAILFLSNFAFSLPLAARMLALPIDHVMINVT